MLAAVESGDAKKLAELIRQDPGFEVNMAVGGAGQTLLHYACDENHRSAVIPLLLAHPDIDVNKKDILGSIPFSSACANGLASCAREMLKDSRVKVNEPDNDGHTPLFWAAYYGHLGVIKWWIVSGREMELGEPGNEKTDVIRFAKWREMTEVVALLKIFKENPEETRYQVRLQLGLVDKVAAEMFALVVFVSDGLL